MKRLLFAPLIFLIILPVFGESLDPKILCMRNRVKFYKERTAYNNFTNYSLKTWYPAITKAKKELGWRPKTLFEDGLDKTINWYREILKK